MATKAKKYGAILIDPPTNFEQKGNYGAIKHYKLMDFDEIASMPVTDLLADNGHIWIWSTAAALPHTFELLKKWNLKYRSMFVWVKPRMGLGVFLRNAAEYVIMSSKNGEKAPIQFKSQMNWGFFPLQDHSHKPEEFHKIVERCSPGPVYLELFARRKYPGWDVWGNEVESDVVLEGYPVPKYSAKVKLNSTEGGK